MFDIFYGQDYCLRDFAFEDFTLLTHHNYPQIDADLYVWQYILLLLLLVSKPLILIFR